MIDFKEISQDKCIEIQNNLRKYIKTEDTFNIDSIKAVAGVDIAYWKEDNKEKAVCCIVVIDINTHQILERQQVYGEVTLPYIPSCLSFREIPLILEVLKKVKSNIDILMLDGNGMLHPRHMGLATHISFYVNKPTIGIAKTYYKVNGQDFITPDNIEGSSTDIEIEGRIVARALRTHKNVKPIFVSIGNRISLDTAVNICMLVVDKNSHIPIPTRLADIDTHTYRNIGRGI